MLALPGAQGPPPWARGAAAAAFIPDSFYGFQAQGYEAQHTPEAIWACWGRGSGLGGLGCSSAVSPWLGRVSGRARGAAQRPLCQRERHNEKVPEPREGTGSPSMATQLCQGWDGPGGTAL